MLPVVASVIIIISLGIILAVLYLKEPPHQKKLKTVRTTQSAGHQEPESRYKSVTASLGCNEKNRDDDCSGS